MIQLYMVVRIVALRLAVIVVEVVVVVNVVVVVRGGVLVLVLGHV